MFFRARHLRIDTVSNTTDLAMFDCSACKNLQTRGAGAAAPGLPDDGKKPRASICPEANFVVLLKITPLSPARDAHGDLPQRRLWLFLVETAALRHATYRCPLQRSRIP